jgi:sterol desaturase/sphingolipid hydroxylase (fatty acid hydroxylase superfamily)
VIVIVSFVVAGAAAWSLAEYALHNWVGHLGRGRNEFSREHLAHHANGNYFTATARKARTAAVALSAVALLCSLALGPARGLAFAAGFLACYVAYEVLHRRAHTHAPIGAYGRWLRKHHFHHHFRNPKANHGVTSPIWDLVFGTYERPGTVRVPRRQAMTWLVDGAGQVHARYAGDYELARPRAIAPAGTSGCQMAGSGGLNR